MDRGEMIESLVNYYTNGNKAKFAAMLGMKPQTLQAWVGRKTMDPVLVFEKCPNVSSRWLLTGEGEMIGDKNIFISHKHIETPSEQSVDKQIASELNRLLKIIEQDKQMLIMKDQQIGKLIDMLDKKTDETFGLAAEDRR